MLQLLLGLCHWSTTKSRRQLQDALRSSSCRGTARRALLGKVKVLARSLAAAAVEVAQHAAMQHMSCSAGVSSSSSSMNSSNSVSVSAVGDRECWQQQQQQHEPASEEDDEALPMEDEGAGPLFDESAVLQVMEVLELPRAAALELLAEHGGDAQAVIMSVFGA